MTMKGKGIIAVLCFWLWWMVGQYFPKNSVEKTESKPGREMAEGVSVRTFDASAKPVIRTFFSVPERVAVFSYNNIETMLALGLADKIVAMDLSHSSRHWQEFSQRYPEELAKVAEEKLCTANTESVLFTEPEVILGWRSLFRRPYLESTEWWQARGINTYIVATSNHTTPKGSVEEEIQYLYDMGEIFQCQEKTGSRIAEIRKVLQNMQDIIAEKEPVSVLVIEGNAGRISNYDEGWLVGDLVAKAGGKIMSNARTLGAEEVLKLNPEVIFVVHFDQATLQFVDTLRSDPKFNSLRAVENERVYPLPLFLMYATGVRTAEGLRRIFSAIHPEMANAVSLL